MYTDFIKRLEKVDGIGELDKILTAREALRRCYAFFNDAFSTTGNPLWLDYIEMITGAGRACTDDLNMWLKKAAQLHASNPDHWPGDVDDGQDA